MGAAYSAGTGTQRRAKNSQQRGEMQYEGQIRRAQHRRDSRRRPSFWAMELCRWLSAVALGPLYGLRLFLHARPLVLELGGGGLVADDTVQKLRIETAKGAAVLWFEFLVSALAIGKQHSD